MAEFPALPLFTDSYMRDCWHLSDADHGRYLLLLILLWQSPQCRIPNDPSWVARKLRRTPEQYEKEIAPLVQEFLSSDGNWLTQKRLQKEFKYVAGATKKRADAAKSRWKKDKDKSNADAKEMQGTCGLDAPTPTPTPTISSPPNGGADSARDPRGFEAWEQALLAVEGVKGSKLEISSMHQMAALYRDGFDLPGEVMPQVKADVAAARQNGRTGVLSWGTLARKIREARLEPASARPGPAREQGLSWDKRLAFAREQRKWDLRNWGPMPNEPGCRVPENLVLPNDGFGWTELGAAS